MKRLLMLIVAMLLLSGAAWGQKFKADDPTAWKLTDSKYGVDFESSVSPYWRPIK